MKVEAGILKIIEASSFSNVFCNAEGKFFRNAICKSPLMVTGLNLPLTNTFQSLFCSGGPVSKQSLNDGAPLMALVEASYTTRSFVDSMVARTTGLSAI